MVTLEARCLDAFPKWLRLLADDASALAAIIESERAGVVEQHSAAALIYLFKSLDLIPDGLEDLGLMDDAFVMRALADTVKQEAPAELELDQSGTVARLAEEAELVREFLGDEYRRLREYASGLNRVTARGRTVSGLFADPAQRSEFAGEVRAWAQSYAAPSFGRDQRNLVKLRAFLLAKLPS